MTGLGLALFARVSTEDQNCEIQLEALRAFAGARGFTVQEEYVERGVSGAAPESRRPVYHRLLNDAKLGKFKAIAVVKLDRLARSLGQLIRTVEQLDALSVDLIVLDQAIDTSTPAGKLLFHVIGAMAEFERELISERVKASQAHRRRKGLPLGRRAKLDREARARLERLWRAGQSHRHITKLLGVSNGTVWRELRRLRGA